MKKIQLIFIFAIIFLALQIGFVYSSSTNTAQQYCTQNGIVEQNAPWYCNQINQAMVSYWEKWSPLAYLAIFFSFDIALILYLSSVLLSNEKLKNLAYSEFYEAMATGLIVIGFLSLSATILGLGPSLIVNANPYTTSLSYINTTISSTQNLVSNLFTIAQTDSIYTSTKLDFCLSATVSTYCVSNVIGVFSFAINYLFIIPASTLISYFMDGLTLLYGEFYLILLFMYAAIPVFLIPGIILRAILPTRALGGLMIAIAIGFYLIMPTLFSVAFYFTNTNLTNQLNSENTFLLLHSSGGNAQINAAYQSSPLVTELNLVQQGMGSFWLSVLFYPVLIFAMVYAIITQLAQFIGGAIQSSSRLKII
ncbi:MAG: hypothetical protein QXD23_00465 [Candidatus Micrarchaeaceae archaeon]